MYHIMAMFSEINTWVINTSPNKSWLWLLLRSLQIPNVVAMLWPGTHIAWNPVCFPLLLWPSDNSLNMCSLCVSCITSSPIIGGITLGWQLYVETLLFLEPGCTDSQEWHHSSPKLPQIFSETTTQCNVIKVKYNPLFIFVPELKFFQLSTLILD